MKGVSLLLIVGLTLFSFPGCRPEPSDQNPSFYHVELSSPPDAGTRYRVQSCLREANRFDVEAIVFEVSSPEGSLLYIRAIRRILQHARQPVLVYLTGKIHGPTSLLAFAGDRLYFHPNAVISAGSLGSGPGLSEEPTIPKHGPMAYARYAFKKDGLDPNTIKYLLLPGKEDLIISNGTIQPEKRSATSGFRGDHHTTENLLSRNSAGTVILTPGDAKKLDLSNGTVPSVPQLVDQYLSGTKQKHQKQTIRRPGEPPFALLVSGATSPVAFIIIMGCGLAFAWLELSEPGFGLSGLFAFLVFLFLFWIHALSGLAEFPEGLFMIGGLSMITVQKFFLPGFGRTGASGSILLITGLLLCRVDGVFPSGLLYKAELRHLVVSILLVIVASGLGLLMFLLSFRFRFSLPGYRWGSEPNGERPETGEEG